MNRSQHFDMNNALWVQKQIELKNKQDLPYYATSKDVQLIQTDMDHFPYKRFFRSVFYESNPTIIEREAGFCVRKDDAYKHATPIVPNPVSYCWQTPCSTVTPCKPKETDDKQKAKTECLNYFNIAP